MDITRQVVTAKDKDSKIIASVTDYYDRFVHKLDGKFAKHSFKKDKHVICPFHEDTDPSMGLIKDKNDKQVEIFHCFGCGASGDVVRMHRRFSYISEGRNITLDDATHELAKIYGIEVDEELAEEQLRSLLGKREMDVERNLGIYNFRSHSANLMKVRMAQDEMSLDALAKNLDVVLNKWKVEVKNAKQGVD